MFHYLNGTIELEIINKQGVKDELMTFSIQANQQQEFWKCTQMEHYPGKISQASVAISITETVIVAASQSLRDVVWLGRVFDEITVFRSVPTLMVNDAAVKLIQNSKYHRRTKTYSYSAFPCLWACDRQIYSSKKVSSEDHLVEIITKPLFKLRLGKRRNAVDYKFNEERCWSQKTLYKWHWIFLSVMYIWFWVIIIMIFFDFV